MTKNSKPTSIPKAIEKLSFFVQYLDDTLEKLKKEQEKNKKELNANIDILRKNIKIIGQKADTSNTEHSALSLENSIKKENNNQYDIKNQIAKEDVLKMYMSSEFEEIKNKIFEKLKNELKNNNKVKNNNFVIFISLVIAISSLSLSMFIFLK